MSSGEQRLSIIPAAAVTDERLEARDLQVLCLLGRHTDNRGWCCRSQVKMARELRCGRATVQRAIGRLVDAGYLEHRPKVRDSGGDAAADYRVMLDVRDELAEAVNSGRREGVPTYRQGVPTSGQGVPAQSGQGVPTHERAPMLTTPLNDTEKERARETSEFEKALRAWPSGFSDNREKALAAWSALTVDEAAEAAAEISRYINANKAIGRSHICAFDRYLAEKQWQGLPPRPALTPARPKAEAPRQVRMAPTAFQRANPHLYPELFGNPSAKQGGAA